ncbi:hypothetical protein NL305_28420, partial [Klebsiella pneumoniae]|nr:hypothetical protein [Klebsiella pneumoniae]
EEPIALLLEILQFCLHAFRNFHGLITFIWIIELLEQGLEHALVLQETLPEETSGIRLLFHSVNASLNLTDRRRHET